jgi:hypothetical protein
MILRKASEAIRSANVQALYNFWDALRGTRRYSARSDFLAEDLVRWWPHLILYEVETAATGLVYRFRVHGESVARSDGGNFMGKLISEVLPAEVLPAILPDYDAVVRSGLPYYSFGRRLNVQGFFSEFERLILPLGADGVDRLLVMLLRSERGTDVIGDAVASGTSAFEIEFDAFLEG